MTSAPEILVNSTDSVTVTWDANGSPYPGTAEIEFGTTPLNYTNTIPQTSAGLATFTPASSGMNNGVFYCKVMDTTTLQTSFEFPIYVAGSNAVQMTAPGNGSAVGTLLPQFQWSPVAGTPYYTVLVFDTNATINIQNGNVSITANVIWGATTNQTSITYGTPDPSHYYDMLTAPPLMQGLTYSWVVLNNYDSSPATVSSTFAGTNMFTVTPPSACGAFTLAAPANDVTVTAVPALSWNASAGANNYEVVLMKDLSGDAQGAFGSATVPLWTGFTNQTSIAIPANIAMDSSWYHWYVIALDNTGKGVKSDQRDFDYTPAVADTQVNITINENTVNPVGTATVPNAIVYISTQSGGAVNVYPLIADNNGGFYVNMQQGSYNFTVKKQGFQTSVVAVPVGASTVNSTITLTRCGFLINGVVKDDSNNTVALAHIQATASGTTYEIDAAADGTFSLPVPATGPWTVQAFKTGYTPVPVSLPGQTPATVTTATVDVTKNLNTLSGKATNTSGQGISGAVVSIYLNGNPATAYTVNTNSTGNYTINLGDGTWNTSVACPGFVAPPPSSVALAGGTAGVINFTMAPSANIISGKVTDNNNNAMQGVLVSAASGTITVQALTDNLGNYSLNCGLGTFSVNASESGWEYHAPSTQINGISFAGGGNISANNNFVLEVAAQPANASAQVSVSSGAVNIQGATVTLTGTGSALGFTSSGITDAAGSVTLSALAAGNYTLTVMKSGYNNFTFNPETLTNNTTTPLTANLSAAASGATISGSASIAGATVRVFDQANPTTQIGGDITAGAGGAYSAPVPAGNYMVTAFKSGYSSSPAQQYASVASGGTATINFTLTQASGGGIVVTSPSMKVYNQGIGSPYQFNASYIDGSGNNVYAVFAWSLSPASAGTISAAGIFTPTADFIGPVTVFAQALGMKGFAAVSVYQKLDPSYGPTTVKDYNGMILTIPAGAASPSNSVDGFTVNESPISRARSSTMKYLAVGQDYAFTDGFMFTSNITMTLPLTNGQGNGKEVLGLWDTANNTWDVVAGSSSVSGRVSAPVAHFSEYTVLSALQSVGVSFSSIAPNPFSPARGPVSIQYICESQNASSVKTTIKVFNMAGKLIRTIVDGDLRPVGILNTETWDGKDDRGRMCLNGRYLLQIELDDAVAQKQSVYSIALVR
jgi:hypothetical protein